MCSTKLSATEHRVNRVCEYANLNQITFPCQKNLFYFSLQIYGYILVIILF